METKEITINSLRRSISTTDFNQAYWSLLNTNRDLHDDDLQMLLRVAVVFLNFGDNHLKKLGYRIIIRYSNTFNDYRPLYDVSINSGYIPIAKFIEIKHFNNSELDEKFFNLYFSSIKDNFKKRETYLSFGQKILARYVEESKDSFVLVAPTSYGKSEILIERVIANKGKRICIIVPSKALLAQTRKRLLGNDEIRSHFKRIITHPDMYKGNEAEFVAVLTQERLLRLLEKNAKLSIDLLLLDEAHNLLKEDERAILLSQVILILKKRKKDIAFNFFTPFISDAKNLQMPYSDYTLQLKSTEETIKIERFFLWELRKNKNICIYDQFIDEFNIHDNSIYRSELEVIKSFKSKKNIVYLNRPRDIEKFAMELLSIQDEIGDESFKKAFEAISDYLHPDYNLLNCLKYGIAYHHGAMPEIIRLYVENLFSKKSGLEFIVTNSTLLEGVNIPAERMFLLTTRIGRNRNFSKAEFKNLIGRICRFSELFDAETGSLTMLEPSVYILNGNYSPSNANSRTYLSKTVRSNVTITDEVNNVLLKNIKSLNSTEVKKANDALTFLENIEPNTVALENAKYVQSEIAKLCFRNNVYDFDIMANESQLIENLSTWSNQNIRTVDILMDAIKHIFFTKIELVKPELARLNNEPAMNFYKKVLGWRINSSSYKQLIAEFLSYWRGLNNPIIFAGSKWGEIPLNDERNNNLYIDLKTKTDAQKVNLAIVRIKEEQDFVDNNLVKYVEILNDLELLENDFYEKIKYGSSDSRIICLLKNGYSIELAKTIVSSTYNFYVNIDPALDLIEIQPTIIQAMETNEENEVVIFEMSYHL